MNSNPVQKLLIANRGEIAVRIIRAARELGISTVAVYSDSDAESIHVKFADEAVCIGPSESAKSYLNVPAIISAAEITAADAVHPGYGFLAENAAFARACQSCGFTWVGPAPEQIETMGDKLLARDAMRKAGLDLLPGSDGPVSSATEAVAIAKDIGFPIIIKAAAGGGGRGMKIVRTQSELRDQVDVARRESKVAFGSDQVYVEKFIERPRHIEFQIAADNHGNIVHLFERECSVQRRYQKLIEEAPSPALTPKERKSFGAKLVKCLKKLKYNNLGTVELLRDDDGSLYFMEMNTRVQVEHPVTELITGVDLVRLQIELAAGKELPFVQDDLCILGHAIECRVNAEDPIKFAPSPGTISALHLPGGNGVRVDTHVTQGAVVPPHYDSLLAKLIVHDMSREQALARMRGSLKEFVVEGIKTNIPFHREVMENADFLRGEYDTKIVSQMRP